MSSEVKIRNSDYMEKQSEYESLQARIREVEDENQELRAQNLIQNRTIVDLRNELVLLRIQMSEMSDTNALLRDRVRSLSQGFQSENEERVGPITVPPLMAPPPVPPPMPSARIRISPRQVGAGEAMTTPLGVSLSSPPRHRIKRDCRQAFYRSTRSPYRRLDAVEAGPSTPPPPFLSPERPNYFVGLRIVSQFQTPFVCSQNLSSGYSDSASDSSGSDDNPQLANALKQRVADGESVAKKPPSSLLKDLDLLKNVQGLRRERVRQAIMQNYNLSLAGPSRKYFFPLPWERRPGENAALPSTSGHRPEFPDSGGNPGADDASRTVSKISDRAQYTFPTIHEGLHHSGAHSVVTSAGQPSRLRKFKKNIPYLRADGVGILDEVRRQSEGDREAKEAPGSFPAFSESLSSMEEGRRPRAPAAALFLGELSSDVEQDGFQADESSNCMTSNENSLEKICISESSMENKE